MPAASYRVYVCQQLAIECTCAQSEQLAIECTCAQSEQLAIECTCAQSEQLELYRVSVYQTHHVWSCIIMHQQFTVAGVFRSLGCGTSITHAAS